MSVKHIKSFLITLCCFLFCTISAYSQAPDESLPTAAAAPTIPAAYPTGIPNYIRSWEPGMPLTDPAVVTGGTKSVRDVKQVTEYFDGLGRLVQTVNKGFGGTGATIAVTGRDLVTPVTYDVLGRETYKYLPYVQQTGNTADGLLKTDPFNAQSTFYKNNMLNPAVKDESIYYVENEFDGSPLSRITRVFNAGNSWNRAGGAKALRTQNLLNTAADSVRIWRIATGSAIPVSSAAYTAGQLYKTVKTDENGNVEVIYKDKDGHIVLRKVQKDAATTAHGGWLCTYYVYNYLGDLSFVIPPLAVQKIMSGWSISMAIADGLCFQYTYDEFKRVISRKIPGKGETQLVYDNFDRLVFTQDGQARAKASKEWQVAFYDDQNRQVMTAIYPSAATREQLQQQMNTVTGTIRTLTYTIPATANLVLSNRTPGISSYQATQSIVFQDGFESEIGAEFTASIDVNANMGTESVTITNPLPNITGYDPITFSYYDNYSYNGAKAFDDADVSMLDPGTGNYPDAVISTNNTKGLATGAKVRVLGTNQWLLTTNFYDSKGRLIQTRADNTAGGETVTTIQHDFSGKVLSSCNHLKNPRSALAPDVKVVTGMSYDHAGRLREITKKVNNITGLTRVILTQEYDELGRLKTKWLGKKPDGTYLDRLSYDYSIRGWIKGINRDFVNNAGSTANWFGEDLSYDYGFSTKQYNGNIAGVKWKSKSNGIARSFGLTYDGNNSLTGADFNQQNTSSTAWTKDQIDFSMKNLVYDANGNLLGLARQGMRAAAIAPVDKLQYAYFANTNLLRFVKDTANDPSGTLGDFKEPAANNTSNSTNPSTDSDYQYDNNGNLVSDKNKSIESITYNHLNLPELITITGKGTIRFTYDATGRKLKKVVTDNTAVPAKITTTDYFTGILYKDDVPVSIEHEEGRIRAIIKTGQPLDWAYDYFEKDHLGNLRIVLTEQSDLSIYAATMETERAAVETATFSNVDESRSIKPVGYPEDNTTSKNASVAKLNAKQGGNKIGPSLVLRVMAGDTIRMRTRAFYKSSTAPDKEKVPAEEMLTALVRAFSNGDKGSSAHRVAMNDNITPFNSDFQDAYRRMKEKDPEQPGRPKAYLNYVLFDDQMKMTDNSSGVKQVKNEPDQLQQLEVGDIPITKNGFMYVYTSNETSQDVYFDNLVVSLATGPLLEETHYYPFGLAMAGISSNALKGTNYPENKLRYNGKELQNNEFSDASGLEWYDYGERIYDVQVSRFLNADPLSDSMRRISHYAYAYNNPMRYVDAEGMAPEDIILRGKDGKSWNIIAPGKDVNLNIPFDLRENKTLSVGLEKITDPGRFAVGYTVSGSFSMAAVAGGQWAGELTHVIFTNSEYGGYNYTYAGGSFTGSVGGQVAFDVAAGVNFFVAFNVRDKPNYMPSEFAGETKAVGYGMDLKDVIGGGWNVSFFTMESGWKGISFGVNIGLGESANMGAATFTTSYSYLLNNQIPTSQRGWIDRATNATLPTQSALWQWMMMNWFSDSDRNSITLDNSNSNQ